jgi:pseudouridylate synthase
MNLKFSDSVAATRAQSGPIVALESTVIAHGLPYPDNLETAIACEKAVLDGGATPATIAVFNGEVHVGISRDQLDTLATRKDIKKISRRDLPAAIGNRLDCATTVATTSFFANMAGIRVFATGGIGGVHRGYDKDISADLPELAQTPIVVVCSGAKIVLDLPATREWLETFGVTVLGWQCDDMPAFYSRSSGLDIDQRVESGSDVARIATARDKLALKNAILVTVPVPAEAEIPLDECESILADALSAADRDAITGKRITPFLLSKMAEMSNGRTLAANIALLKNNARVAAEIAVAMSSVT